MERFAITLIQYQLEMLEFLPRTVIDGLKKYKEMKDRNEFKNFTPEKKTLFFQKLEILEDMAKLKVYSWNGESFDLAALLAPLLDVLSRDEKTFGSLQVIRRGSGVMQLTYGNLIFRDFMNYSRKSYSCY